MYIHYTMHTLTGIKYYIVTIQNLSGLFVNFKYNSCYIFLFQYLILATEGIF